MSDDNKTIIKYLQKIDNRLTSVEKNIATNMATKKDLNTMATKKDLNTMATKKDLNTMATKDDLKGFATKDDLKGLATKSDLKEMATKKDLRHLETRMNQRFDVVDNDLAVLLKHSDGQDKELEKRVDNHERRIKKLETPPPTAHSIKQ